MKNGKWIAAILVSFVLSIVGAMTISNDALAVDEVKIGVVLPLSGPLAPIGINCRSGSDFAMKRINDAGGIQSLGGAKLNIIYADSTGVPEVGTSETERLVIREKVPILMGAYQSSVTFPASMIGEKYKVPYIVLISVRDDIVIGRGFKYIFRCGVASSQQAQGMIDFVVDMNKKHDKKARKVALVYENSDFGQSVIAGVKKFLKDTDLRIVLDEPYPTKLADFTPVVTKLKSAEPDVIFRIQYVSDAILFTKALAEKKVDVMGIIGAGGGEADPTFVPSVGLLGEYHLTNPAYTPTMPYVIPWLKQINDDYKTANGRDITTDGTHGIFNLYFIKDALERARSTDPQKIRDAMAATDIKGYNNPWFLFPFEGLKFDKDGQNIYSVPTMSQYLGQKLYAVWPEKYQLKGKELAWPMPPWAQREKK